MAKELIAGLPILGRNFSDGLQVSGPDNPAVRQFGRRFQLGIELHF